MKKKPIFVIIIQKIGSICERRFFSYQVDKNYLKSYIFISHFSPICFFFFFFKKSPKINKALKYSRFYFDINKFFLIQIFFRPAYQLYKHKIRIVGLFDKTLFTLTSLTVPSKTKLMTLNRLYILLFFFPKLIYINKMLELLVLCRNRLQY